MLVIHVSRQLNESLIGPSNMLVMLTIDTLSNRPLNRVTTGPRNRLVILQIPLLNLVRRLLTSPLNIALRVLSSMGNSVMVVT